MGGRKFLETANRFGINFGTPEIKALAQKHLDAHPGFEAKIKAKMKDEVHTAEFTLERYFAEMCVRAYRTAYPKIKEYWFAVLAKAKEAITTGEPTTWTYVTFHLHRDRWLLFTLPSGRVLPYYDAFLKSSTPPWGEPTTVLGHKHVNPQTKRWESTESHGSKLAENITQAVCRDLLAHSMQRLDEEGHKIICHVHDEVVIEGNPGDLAPVRRVMSEAPDWCPDFPVQAEGFETLRYRKG